MANLDNNNARNESGAVGSDIIRTPITEAELRAKEAIGPEDVLRLNCITEGILNNC